MDQAVSLSIPVGGLGDATFAVSAARLSAAINVAGVGGSLSIGDSRLTVKSGKFTARLELFDVGAFPWGVPSSGEAVPIEALVSAMAKAGPFSYGDAWASAIAIRDGRVLASDGVSTLIAVRGAPLGIDVSLPGKSVVAVAGSNLTFARVSVDENSMTLIGEGGWLRLALTSIKWPDVSSLLNDSELPEAPPGFWEAVATVSGFDGDHVLLSGAKVSSGPVEVMLDYDVAVSTIVMPECVFNTKKLASIASIAGRIDLSLFPKCPFGDGIDTVGVLSGTMPK